jgi:nicotinate phosphoribosyltransferase
MPQLAISDEYFNRSAAIVVNTPLHNQLVRYAVFAREKGILCGINRAVAFIEQQCLGPLIIYAYFDGAKFKAQEAVMIIEGLFGELVNLETTYLGMLAFSGAATSMARIVQAADPTPVVDMAARHYPYEIIEQTAYAAALGGAQGTSTRAGWQYVRRWLGTKYEDMIQVDNRLPFPFKLYGSIPHALNAVFRGSSIESAQAYRKKFPDIPLTVLIDFEGRELDIACEAARVFGDALYAVRLDTSGDRIHQGGHDKTVPELMKYILTRSENQDAVHQALSQYGFGPGVTIESVYNLRRSLDQAGAKNTRIMVTSGFTAEKVTAFRACHAPMDAIGTGSWVEFVVFTSDITHIGENGRWIPRCKAGRYSVINLLDLPVRIKRN